MKAGLTITSLVLTALWLFQGRANLVALCGSWPYIPDLVSLGVVLIACRSTHFTAVTFGLITGLLSDVSVGQPFGFYAFVNAFSVALFLPTKKLFYYESKAAIFGAVLVFTLAQKLTVGFYLTAGVPWAFYLSRIVGVCFMTALVALLLFPMFDYFLDSSKSSKVQRRGPFRR
jgi:rod shape-determining protein MreD